MTDLDPDMAMVDRHMAILKRYEGESVADILQDICFLSQLVVFRQQYEGRLAALHVERGNASCVCRTSGCGHRADQHPNGVCNICKTECWS